MKPPRDLLFRAVTGVWALAFFLVSRDYPLVFLLGERAPAGALVTILWIGLQYHGAGKAAPSELRSSHFEPAPLSDPMHHAAENPNTVLHPVQSGIRGDRAVHFLPTAP